MKINFYPESSSPSLIKYTDEYRDIWNKYGESIVNQIQNISGLNFIEKEINAIVYPGISYSFPLRLQSDLARDHKIGSLTHEIIHRLITGNNLQIITDIKDLNTSMSIHKHLYLILYDVWCSLFGEKFAEKEVSFELNLWTGNGENYYKLAWDWALSKNKNERQIAWINSNLTNDEIS